MVDSGLRIALDPLYPPPNLQKRMNTQISLIQWQLSFDEDVDAPKIEALQARVAEERKLSEMEGHRQEGELGGEED